MIRSQQRRASGPITLADQICSSGSNFSLLLLVAETSDTGSFGIFSLMFGVLTIGLGVERAALGVPLGLDAGNASAADTRGQVGRATCVAAVAGCVVTGLVTAFGFLAHHVDGSVLLLAAVAPIVMIQDLWRFAAMAQRRPGAALSSDLVWLTLALVALGMNVFGGDNLGRVTSVAIWSLGALVAAAVLVVLRVSSAPRLVGTLRMLGEPRRRHLAGDGLLAATAPVVTSTLVALTVTTTALGAVRGAATLMSPLNVLLAAVPLGVLPIAARRTLPEARRLVRNLSLLLLGTAALWGVALVLTPSSIGTHLLGMTWVHARPLLPFTTVEYCGVALWTGAVTMLRLQERTRVALALRAMYACGTAVLVLILTALLPLAVTASITMAGTALFVATSGWLIASRSDPSHRAARRSLSRMST